MIRKGKLILPVLVFVNNVYGMNDVLRGSILAVGECDMWY